VSRAGLTGINIATVRCGWREGVLPCEVTMIAPVRLMSVVTCVALLGHAVTAAAEDWPVLRQGRWQFDRTLEGYSEVDGRVTREVLVAKRLGDCAK
jgi:hypothetical protein